MRQGLNILLSLVIGCAAFQVKSTCQAQSIAAEERFQDLFVTAGYGTAFGAAMGTALLSFQSDPNKNLRYIAIGASLGFIGGSILGSYIVFSPVFVTPGQVMIEPSSRYQPSKLQISPGIDLNTGKITGLWSNLKIAEF